MLGGQPLEINLHHEVHFVGGSAPGLPTRSTSSSMWSSSTSPPKGGKATAAMSLWAVAAGSKLVVLELVDVFFGDAVSLGGFLPVTLLVVALLVSRAAVRRLLYDTPTPA